MTRKLTFSLIVILTFFIFAANYSYSQENTNCGSTDADILDQNFKSEENNTLVCLGEKFFNNCEEANAVINNDEFIIKGGDFDKCIIAGTNNEDIEVNLNNVIDDMKDEYDDPESMPGTLASTIVFYGGIISLSNDNNESNETDMPSQVEVTESKYYNNDLIKYMNENSFLATSYSDGFIVFESTAKKDMWDEYAKISIYSSEYDSQEKINIEYEKLKQHNLDVGRKIDNKQLNFVEIDDYALYEEFTGEIHLIIKSDQIMHSIFYSGDKSNIEDSIIIGMVDNLITEETVTNSEKINEARKKQSGKIILKVEDSGEAYYIHPINYSMYYLGRPDDAFAIMREQGIGITDNNLVKIPVGLNNLTGLDSDKDGLPDLFEDAIGTNKNNPDSDGDGYNDKVELLGNYNPNGSGRLSLDDIFSNQQKGKIFLQIEGNGEAWYINPTDGKRYFLGRPADAFQIMRNLGLGISNNDFDKL